MLFDSDLCTNLGHLRSDLLGLFLGDGFFNRLGSLVNDCLGFFQAQTCKFAYNFDDVDLVRANL